MTRYLLGALCCLYSVIAFIKWNALWVTQLGAWDPKERGVLVLLIGLCLSVGWIFGRALGPYPNKDS